MGAMIYLIWNCQGLGSDLTVRALHGFIKECRPSAVFLMEKKMQSIIIDRVRSRMGFQNGYNAPPYGLASGLSLWWDESVNVDVVFSFENLIDTKMQILSDGSFFRASWIYGMPYREQKLAFWGWLGS